ncbi:MAG: metallophosphoesterase [bacterium]
MKSREEPFSLRSFYLGVLSALLLVAFFPFSTQADSWKWIAYGDTRSNDDQHRKVLQSIMNNTPDYRFIINVGDVVASGGNASLWETWQKACDDVLGGTGQGQVPPRYMACPGNHDDCDSATGLANWNTYLSGQAEQFGNEGRYFVLDYENARFIIMDSNASKAGEQYDMLMNAIQNNPKTWLFVFWHHPIFDFGPKEYRGDIHETWGVPLYQNGCDIMFMGHAHYYVRSKKLELNGEKNPPLDPNTGTVQVVAGNGGVSTKSVNPDNDGNGYMVDSYTSEHGYSELTIDGNTLRMRHILSDGTVFDEVFYTANPKPGVPSEVGPATMLVMISGSDQTAPVGSTLPEPFVVETRDANNNPVPGVAVTFEVTSGGGTLSNSQPQYTGANGRASTFLTLGPVPGINLVSADAPGLSGSPQVFTATALAPDTTPPAPPMNIRVEVGD